MMDIDGYSQSYNRFGGSAIYSFVGDLLTVRLGDYGTALESIEIVAYLRSASRNPRRTLENLFDRFHAHYLKKLPSVTFRRKLKRVEIRFLSEHFTAEDDDGWDPSAGKCNLAAAEVAAALPLLKKRIKSADDFDTERFLADAAEVLRAKIDTLEEWEQIAQVAKEKRKANLATKSPWELLEIDWDHYHPHSRDVLDDPFFWEVADDLAPNGNDTGADLLEDFRRWHKRHPTTSPLKFLDRLMARWGIEPIDWTVTDEATVRNLEQDDSITLGICNETAIGLAFAVIKMRATCPLDVIQLGLAALTRTSILVKDSTLSSEIKREWDVAIGKMRRKLESLRPSG